MKNLLNSIFIIVVGCVLFVTSCKEEEVPDNPYDDVDYGSTDVYVDSLDENSITAIHRDIFKPKCATPGCHDGSFEPDFRTVQSTYSTTVYHGINKNSPDSAFTFRVVPSNSAMSVLYERISNCCFVNTNDRMPQDNIGDPLPDDDITRIKTWIDNGAKDFTGNNPIFPNTQPTFPFFVMVDSKFPAEINIISDAANREGNIDYYPILLGVNDTVSVAPIIEDDSTAIGDLTGNKLLFSYLADDFSNPIKTVIPYKISIPDDFWVANFNTSSFLSDTTIYMRYYTNDGDNPDSEFPKNSSHPFYKTLWAIKTIP